MSDKPKYPADVIPGGVTARRETSTATAQPRGEVVSLRPKLPTDRAAAEYCARSPSWIRARRAADTQARREARASSGPPWTVIGRSVFYKLTDLDGWIESHAVPYGQVKFANRGHSTAHSERRQTPLPTALATSSGDVGDAGGGDGGNLPA